ncbi:prepilin-type N-terminal cleavage/methylation domain-containing protein [Bulleidia sp. zg-1006]|uniref:prepilin-type N-terminal cleavage/methylation domain-containing protein n=1 Tax=Bulleidia sp. zg-1006 TaxID=2806552 RepID=UPI00193A4DB4|nr:prepilin-type N-terminal cleavage/methylation domain-containing protein [Bulleidia sp. zg-1006]QRG86023.1 prepilin-type N-terminal cleavage/methylation domain-containing protein [Bulleidia sp. zg-1006]
MDKPKFVRAFSLMELLVVLSVLSVLFLWTPKPHFQSSMSKQEWSLNYLLAQSQAMANKRNGSYEGIFFYPNGYVNQGQNRWIDVLKQKVVIRIAQGRLRWE